jgi:hypothetical protein
MRAKRILVVAGAAALAACGRQADLKPAPGHAMPVKPLMARTTPTVEQLLTPPSYARPDRIDELVKRSQPRRADPNHHPPPTPPTPPTHPPPPHPPTHPHGSPPKKNNKKRN